MASKKPPTRLERAQVERRGRITVVVDAPPGHDVTILSDRTRELLQGHTVIYLEISVAEGLRRTGANNHRPLLAGGDPKVKYQELMRRRRPLYRRSATIRIRTDGRSPARVVGQLVSKLQDK